MMRRTDLALRALRLLEEVGDTALRASELAQQLGSRPTFVPQVLGPLVRAGWLESGTGPKGGYRLVTDLESRNLLELIELLEGPTETGRCVLRGSGCSEADPCSLHDAWVRARGSLLDRLASTPVSTSAPVGRE